MPVSIEEAKAFKEDAIKYREDWFSLATKSWGEIKKRQKDNRLWSITPNSLRRKSRYPAWFSIFKIRKPIVFSRAGIPICKDTTESGNDSVGAAAALCKERLAINVAKTFDYFDNISAAVDDFLVTDFGQVRGFFTCEDVKQEKKILLTPQVVDPSMPPSPENMVFLDENGNKVVAEEIIQEDGQFFAETEEVIDVKNEKVYLEPVIYRDFLVDPHITKWSDCKRIIFINYYSQPQFRQDFGSAALAEFKNQVEKEVGADEAAKKSKTIKVYEYWDAFDKETYWFTDYNRDFIKPTEYLLPENEMGEEKEILNGIYNLEKFFPCPKPLLINTATDEFWPMTEYYQLVDIFEDIHTIFTRMVTCTRAIRSRMLFDSSIEGLQAALNELSETDAIGVENLAQALVSNGGSLEAAVQYINVAPIIETLQQLYQALEQRLNTVYKLTGTADLLQGLITDPTQRTLGERQMTEKYALNQVADRQRKVQEFVRDSYELLTEMALKNFKDDTLKDYINPATFPQGMQPLYDQAIALLKNNSKRFRIELETDSTISLNEEYDKQARIELVNTLTAALEKTANIAQSQPELVQLELHCLKFLIQGFRQSKLFQDEVTQAIDAVIQQTQAASQDPAAAFDPEQAKMQLEQQKLQLDTQYKQAMLQSTERIEMSKLQQSAQMQAIQSQLEQFRLQVEQGNASQQMQLDYAKLQADIAQAQQELQVKHDALIVEMQKAAEGKQLEEFRLMLDQQIAQSEQQLAAAEQTLAEQKMRLDENEKYMTEARLQSEHKLQQMEQQIRIATMLKESQPEPVKQPDIIVNMPPNPKTKKKTKVQRDEMGNILNFETEDIVE